MKPKITIVIPCYNAEKWISESINSALSQTYTNKEIIFVDNESSDNSLEIAKEIQTKNQELMVFTAPNLYRYSWEEPVNEALSHATGDYFTILGADDFIADDYIENIAGIISAAPDKIKVFQSPILGVQGDREKYLGEISHQYKNLQEFKTSLFKKCPVTTPSVVYKKELYDKGIIRWKSKEYLGSVDYELYFNIADNGIFIYPYPKWIGYYYRWHDGQATWGMHKEVVNYDQVIRNYWREKWKQG
jgi:glycosyltransferase involved in cell wall biosynthesis